MAGYVFSINGHLTVTLRGKMKGESVVHNYVSTTDSERGTVNTMHVREQGMSLVELMVGILVGLLVVMAASGSLAFFPVTSGQPIAIETYPEDSQHRGRWNTKH